MIEDTSVDAGSACQIRLSHVQTKVPMVDMSRRIIMETKNAVGNAMLPVPIVPSRSLGEVLVEHAPSRSERPPQNKRARFTRSKSHLDSTNPSKIDFSSLGGRTHCSIDIENQFKWRGHMRAPIPPIGEILCFSAQAAVAFQRYRFNNGLIVGATLAAVSCYDDTTRRKGLRPSQMQLMVIATAAAAATMIVQQVLSAFVHF
jgi:hypothetical protein